MKIQQGNEEINSNGGILLAGGLLAGLESLKKVDKMAMGKVKKGQISHSGILRSAAGLLCLGKTDFTDIETRREDVLFRRALALPKAPSEECLRQRLNGLAQSVATFDAVEAANLELLSQVKDYGCEKTPYAMYAPVDIDVSTLDNSGSHKENVSWTYQNYDGYAPIFAYLGTRGHMLANELRPGNQHCQKGTTEFVAKCLAAAKKLGVKNALFRFDSGNDDAGLAELLLKSGQAFIIKRNLRHERLEQWLATARRVGEKMPSRAGKNVYVGMVSHLHPGGREELGPIFTVFEVTERLTDAKTGEAFLLPEIEVNTFWANLPEEAATIIELYHRHGASEQFHSELKSDIGLERMPSGRFATNNLFLRLALLAYNALRIIGQRALQMKAQLPVKLKVERRRLRSVMQDLIYIGCKLIRHAGAEILKFGRHCPWFGVFEKIYATI
jgi:hypothetical protein